MEHGEEILDLELMDRIDLHDPTARVAARPAPGLAGRFQYSTFFLMPLGRVQKTGLGAPKGAPRDCEMVTNHGPFRTRLPAIRQVVAGTWKPEDPHGERVFRLFHER